jgi:hypothetical protein
LGKGGTGLGQHRQAQPSRDAGALQKRTGGLGEKMEGKVQSWGGWPRASKELDPAPYKAPQRRKRCPHPNTHQVHWALAIPAATECRSGQTQETPERVVAHCSLENDRSRLHASGRLDYRWLTNARRVQEALQMVFSVRPAWPIFPSKKTRS